MPNVVSNTADHKAGEVASTTMFFAKNKAGSSNPLSPHQGNYSPYLHVIMTTDESDVLAIVLNKFLLMFL